MISLTKYCVLAGLDAGSSTYHVTERISFCNAQYAFSGLETNGWSMLVIMVIRLTMIFPNFCKMYGLLVTSFFGISSSVLLSFQYVFHLTNSVTVEY